ncbi:hypothetical protein [Pedobacter faecalis]|uniref:hypothetical protein n=1 Tax=Pedobacter faecalis TaxID=3041495 RepID=UPI00254B2238|nr:hypothetical protein [Pedobacter sp. ELA7]
MTKPDLSTLPRHIVKVSRKWFQNTKTGAWIPANKIERYLPKPAPDHDAIMAKRWDLQVETHEILSEEQVYIRTSEII